MASKDYKPNIAVPPGATLLETIEHLCLSQKELARRTDLTPKTINEIIQGKCGITPETAIKLERVLGIRASFWNNLEMNYRQTLARLEAEENLQNEIELARGFSCYNELAKWGAVEKTRAWEKKAEQLLIFFAVNSLTLVPELETVAFRIAETRGLSDKSLAAWLRWGEREAEKKDVPDFDKVKLRESIPEFRHLTREEPQVFGERLASICTDCGVKLVLTPHLKGAPVNGAVRWHQDRPLIQLSLRNGYSDIFWFTFFHEIGHIWLHGKKDCFLDVESSFSSGGKEQEANSFAASHLIPKGLYARFVARGDFRQQVIRAFAESINISPGIVAGRLAHDGIVAWKNIAALRTRLQFAAER